MLITMTMLCLFSAQAGASGVEAQPARIPDDRGPSVPCQGSRNPIYNELGVYTGRDVGIIISGRCVDLDEDVYIVNGSTLLPMREMLQRMRPAYYDNVVFAKWFPEHQTACADETSNVICYPIGRDYVYWNGVIQPLRQGAVIFSGRTRVPFRDLVEKSGGTVHWDGDTWTITVDVSGPDAFFIWAKPEDVCRIMGLEYDGNCDADRVIAGHYTYKTWGTDFVIDRMLDGTLQQPGMTYFMNQIGLDKKGTPLEGPALKWTEAILNTGLDILTAMWIGAEIRYAQSVRGTVTPVGRELVIDGSAAEGLHEVYFWAPRTSVSEHALKYQVRGNTSLLRVVNGKRQALEYAYNGIAFDAKEDIASTGVRIFIERKSDAGYILRLSKYKPEFLDTLANESAQEMFLQFKAIRTRPNSILAWEVETAEMFGVVDAALNQKVLAKLVREYGQAAGTTAYEQLKEMFRLSIVP